MINLKQILVLSSSLFLASCSLLEQKLLQSEGEIDVHQNLKLPKAFTKTLIVEGKLEKVTVTREEDSILFFKEMDELYSLKTEKILGSKLNNLSKDTLYSLGLEYDSISVVGDKEDARLTFFYTKKNSLFTIEKVFFITSRKEKILSKNIKIKQELLHEKSKLFEIDFHYTY